MSAQKMIKNFNGKLVGSLHMQELVCRTLNKLLGEMVSYLCKNCWFLSSSPDAWAFTFNGNDILNNHFIFLSDELLSQGQNQIQFTILHEVGHVILKHKNSINYLQTQREIKQQEKEADCFAKYFI